MEFPCAIALYLTIFRRIITGRPHTEENQHASAYCLSDYSDSYQDFWRPETQNYSETHQTHLQSLEAPHNTFTAPHNSFFYRTNHQNHPPLHYYPDYTHTTNRFQPLTPYTARDTQQHPQPAFNTPQAPFQTYPAHQLPSQTRESSQPFGIPNSLRNNTAKNLSNTLENWPEETRGSQRHSFECNTHFENEYHANSAHPGYQLSSALPPHPSTLMQHNSFIYPGAPPVYADLLQAQPYNWHPQPPTNTYLTTQQPQQHPQMTFETSTNPTNTHFDPHPPNNRFEPPNNGITINITQQNTTNTFLNNLHPQQHPQPPTFTPTQHQPHFSTHPTHFSTNYTYQTHNFISPPPPYNQISETQNFQLHENLNNQSSFSNSKEPSNQIHPTQPPLSENTFLNNRNHNLSNLQERNLKNNNQHKTTETNTTSPPEHPENRTKEEQHNQNQPTKQPISPLMNQLKELISLYPLPPTFKSYAGIPKKLTRLSLFPSPTFPTSSESLKNSEEPSKNSEEPNKNSQATPQITTKFNLLKIIRKLKIYKSIENSASLASITIKLQQHKTYLQNLESFQRQTQEENAILSLLSEPPSFDYPSALSENNRSLSICLGLQLLVSGGQSLLPEEIRQAMTELPVSDAATLICQTLLHQPRSFFPPFISALYSLMSASSPEEPPRSPHFLCSAILKAFPSTLSRITFKDFQEIYNSLLEIARESAERVSSQLPENLLLDASAGIPAEATADLSILWHAVALLSKLRASQVRFKKGKNKGLSEDVPALLNLLSPKIISTAPPACLEAYLEMIQCGLSGSEFLLYVITHTPPPLTMEILSSEIIAADHRDLLIEFWVCKLTAHIDCIFENMDVIFLQVHYRNMHLFFSRVPLRLLTRIPEDSLCKLGNILLAHQRTEIFSKILQEMKAVVKISPVQGRRKRKMNAVKLMTVDEENGRTVRVEENVRQRHIIEAVLENILNLDLNFKIEKEALKNMKCPVLLLWMAFLLQKGRRRVAPYILDLLNGNVRCAHALASLICDLSEETHTVQFLTTTAYTDEQTQVLRSELLQVLGEAFDELTGDRVGAEVGVEGEGKGEPEDSQGLAAASKKSSKKSSKKTEETGKTGKTEEEEEEEQKSNACKTKPLYYDIRWDTFVEARCILETLPSFIFTQVLPRTAELVCDNFEAWGVRKVLEMMALLVRSAQFKSSMSVFGVAVAEFSKELGSGKVGESLGGERSERMGEGRSEPFLVLKSDESVEISVSEANRRICERVGDSMFDLYSYLEVLESFNRLAWCLLGKNLRTSKTFKVVESVQELLEFMQPYKITVFPFYYIRGYSGEEGGVSCRARVVAAEHCVFLKGFTDVLVGNALQNLSFYLFMVIARIGGQNSVYILSNQENYPAWKSIYENICAHPLTEAYISRRIGAAASEEVGTSMRTAFDNVLSNLRDLSYEKEHQRRQILGITNSLLSLIDAFWGSSLKPIRSNMRDTSFGNPDMPYNYLLPHLRAFIALNNTLRKGIKNMASSRVFARRSAKFNKYGEYNTI